MHLCRTEKITPFRTLALCLSALILCSSADAARIIFYRAKNGNPNIEKRLELASRFYGIEMFEPPDRFKPDTNTLSAAVIDAALLTQLNPEDLPENIQAVLIAGINDQTSIDALNKWTGGSFTEKPQRISKNSTASLQISDDMPELTFELAGQTLPADIATATGLPLNAARPIMTYPNALALFSQSESTYLLADMSVNYPANASIWFYDHGVFAEIAPYMMFIKKTFGDYGWHTDRDYANLTIDDPWLRKSYGNLNYADLLQEMDRANFHTTIGYVPWNYDRASAPETVELFKTRPDRYSICIHGNNHDHREFYRYKPLLESHWPARPFPEHEADIRQGLARIRFFEVTSGLTVDRVMVFPHGIAPNPTLGLLKKYNFLATSNIEKVPLDTPPPEDPLFWLLRTTDKFGGGLAVVDRTETQQRTTADIAIDLFLDNPVLFVEHLLFFSEEISAFNATARKINDIQPNTKWAGMGAIVRHLYRIRKLNNETYAVHSLSPDTILTNPDGVTRKFHFTKKGDGRPAFHQILVDGISTPHFVNENGDLQINLEIPPKEQRRIQITFLNDFVPEDEDLSKSDLHIHLLRTLSDVRDQHLTAGPLGIFIERYYYQTGIYYYGIKALAIVAAVILAVLIVAIILIQKTIKKRHE